ncbi:MAG: hypothetical protein P8Y45_12140 [Exilibacterium sp.]
MNDALDSKPIEENATDTRYVVVKTLLSTKNAGDWNIESLPGATLLGSGGLEINSLPLLQVFVKLEGLLKLRFVDADVANANFTTVDDLVHFVHNARSHHGVAASPVS